MNGAHRHINVEGQLTLQLCLSEAKDYAFNVHFAQLSNHRNELDSQKRQPFPNLKQVEHPYSPKCEIQYDPKFKTV
jgi:hypothetical protein